MHTEEDFFLITPEKGYFFFSCALCSLSMPFMEIGNLISYKDGHKRNKTHTHLWQIWQRDHGCSVDH